MSNYGFFRDGEEFKRKFIYYHFLPSAATIGANIPHGKTDAQFIDSLCVGTTVQNYLVELYLAKQ